MAYHSIASSHEEYPFREKLKGGEGEAVRVIRNSVDVINTKTIIFLSVKVMIP